MKTLHRTLIDVLECVYGATLIPVSCGGFICSLASDPVLHWCPLSFFKNTLPQLVWFFFTSSHLNTVLSIFPRFLTSDSISQPSQPICYLHTYLRYLPYRRNLFPYSVFNTQYYPHHPQNLHFFSPPLYQPNLRTIFLVFFIASPMVDGQSRM